MISLLCNILIIMIMAEFVIGNFANMFIALVNCTDWVKRRRISSTDQILTALAISRVGLICTLIANWFLIVFHQTAYSKVRITLRIFWSVSNHFGSWLATALSIFYVLKITNFSNFIFLYLKRKVNRVSPVTVLGTLVLLPFDLTVTLVYDTMEVKGYLGNVTWKLKLKDAIHSSKRTIFTLVNLLPFLTCLICVLLLISSLRSHLRKMQLYGKGSQDPSTKVHVKVLQTAASFVMLYAMYSLSVITSDWWLEYSWNKPVYLFSLATEILYPLGHSCVLIWANKKLKQAFLLVLRQAKCWLKELEPLQL